jgi:hypothetical protein
MPAFLTCETCFRLWADYGAAATEVRAGTRDLNLALEAAERRKIAGEAIRVHEADAHQNAQKEVTERNSDKAQAANA